MSINNIVRLVPLLLLTITVSAGPLDQPAPDAVAEARGIVHEMINGSRGPYGRIRWYCNDGTVKAPVEYACREHGGGRQHAEYSVKRQRLVQLGWSVGTIYASLSFDELFTSSPRQQRLRELALEQYLVDIDNGWVLQQARGIRGRVQLEDEEAAGRSLLLRLLNDHAWMQNNFLLVRESVRVIPHGVDSDLARKVRRNAVELAVLDSGAERWRAEVHGTPNAGIPSRLRQWLKTRSRPETVALGEQLANDIDRLYGPSGRSERINTLLSQVRKPVASAVWRQSVMDAMKATDARRIEGLCTSLASARSTLIPQLNPENRLLLLDAVQGLESEVRLTYQDITGRASLSRGALLQLGQSLADCVFAAGLLSTTEHASLTRDLAIKGDGANGISLASYRDAVFRFKRTPNWAVGTVRHTFAEALIRYAALEPKAARFSDDLLRGSPMWMFGDLLKVLSKDLDTLMGSVVHMNGHDIASAVALNGGIARGTLRIFETIESVEAGHLNATDIVVLPETIAELSPVAGILTLGEGNALSHVQLLARNFGIPNVAIDQDTVDLLKPLEGTAVVLIIDDYGNVILQKEDQAAIGILDQSSTLTDLKPNQVKVPAPNLSMKRLLPLSKIRRNLSGKVIGPKAANLGELNRIFPGRVAPAIAIPFGIYAEHLQDAQLMPLIGQSFADLANGSIEKPEFDTRLADVRKRIAALEPSATLKADLLKAMHVEFGEPGTYGIFVRSDTNVEDLPQFTGAGLNETIPNVVGLDAQLPAIPKVWSSVFSPRALAWRSSVLANPDQIYASVLLMKSVPSTKSGVLVTSNLFDRSKPALTVSAAWGVGGAVAGESAESVVIHTDRTESYAEAKSPYQRNIAVTGGMSWAPAPAGAVLEQKELEALRQLAAEVNKKYAPVFDDEGKPRPWDIEFGFVEGELTLFQIRPLVERGNRNTNAVLRKFQPQLAAPAVPSLIVPLAQVPGALNL